MSPAFQVDSLPLSQQGNPNFNNTVEQKDLVRMNDQLSQSFETPQTVACQAALSMGFPRQEYWSGLPFPPPEDLPNPWIEPMSLMPSAFASGFFNTSAIWEAQ